ncbi:unnamed protein product [Arctogadus glacialis]
MKHHAKATVSGKPSAQNAFATSELKQVAPLHVKDGVLSTIFSSSNSTTTSTTVSSATTLLRKTRCADNAEPHPAPPGVRPACDVSQHPATVSSAAPQRKGFRLAFEHGALFNIT